MTGENSFINGTRISQNDKAQISHIFSGNALNVFGFDGADFVLEWKELGGPPIRGTPERKGFGTQMATRSVVGQLNGSLTYDWAPGGLTLRLSVAAANLLG